MRGESLRDRYALFLQDYVARPEETLLLAAADLGRELVKVDIPSEEIAEIHEEALRRLADEHPNMRLGEVAHLISAPFMEMSVAYGLAYREQLEAHRRAEQQLRLQASALEAAANAIVITGQKGTIQWVNPAFTSVTGYTAEEAIGKNHRLLESGKQDQSFYRRLRKTILSGRVWHGEVINQRKDGTLYAEEETITPVRDARGEIAHFIHIKQDITQRKWTEELKQELKAIHDVARIVTSNLDIGQVYERFALEVKTLIPFDRMSITLADESEGVWRVEHTLGHPDPFEVGRAYPLEDSATGYLVKRGETVVSNSTGKEFRFWSVRLHAEAGLASFIMAPLRVKERIFGGVALSSFTANSYGPRERRLLESLASQIAPAIENA
ncbi:MAG: PAS domain S-box protein, partial [Dehalococcoidia bacterium]